jgi:Uma2 family endonuclease
MQVGYTTSGEEARELADTISIMSKATSNTASPPVKPETKSMTEPVWEVATMFPNQGEWSEASYLDLTSSCNRLIELTDGRLEFLPMPTKLHQRVVRFIFGLLADYVEEAGLGEVFFSPIRLRIRTEKFREADIVYVSAVSEDNEQSYCSRADLVMEIVSDDGRDRDLIDKRHDYAEAGIGEYWIVDPREELITVLTLREGAYSVQGEYRRGQQAMSAMLAGFGVEVAAVFDAAKPKH